jgi:hypothetical protein
MSSDSCLDSVSNVLQTNLKTLVFAIYDPSQLLNNESSCECSPNIIDLKPYSDRQIATDVLKDSTIFSQNFTNVFTPVIINSEFQNLFYSSSNKSYNISNSHKYSPAIDFGSQTLSLGYENVKFSLFDACCDKFTEKNGCYPDALRLILLSKELSPIKSLHDLKCNTKALNYDGIIDYFTSTNQIKRQECKPATKAVALPLGIQVNFYCVSLDVSLLIQFNYLVAVPGFDIIAKSDFVLPLVSPDDIINKSEETSRMIRVKNLASSALANLSELVINETEAQCGLCSNLNDLSQADYVSQLKDEQCTSNYYLRNYEQNKSLELIQPIVCSIANNYDSEFNYQLGQVDVYHIDTCLNKSASYIEGIQHQLGLQETPYNFAPLDLSTSDYLGPSHTLCTEFNPPQVQKLVIVPPPETDCGEDDCGEESS